MNLSSPIGQIGLGLLGGAIARRLLDRGRSIVGFDTRPEVLQTLQEAGGTPASTAQQVAQQTTTLLLCLPHSGIVANLLDQLAPSFTPKHLLIDCTTGDPQQMADIGNRLAAQGVRYLDACVLGSSAQAREGNVILSVGGSAEAFAEARPLLEEFSSRIAHLGPCGHGARFKLVHNLILGLHRAVLAEGLVLAEQLELDPRATLELLQQTPAASTVMAVKGRKMLDRDFTPQATVSQHLKDVRLILDQGQKHGLTLPLSTLHAQLLTQLEAAGFGPADNTSIIKIIENQTQPEA